MSIFENFAALRAAYPDDLKDIEAEEKRVADLLKGQEYFLLETTQELVALCRRDIVNARRKLATDRGLVGNEPAQRDFWQIIDARTWFLQMVAKDYATELATIEQELEAELAR